MGPKSAPKSEPVRWQVPPEELEATREALAEAERGELMTLTPEMMDRIAETGEWPEFVRDPE